MTSAFRNNNNGLRFAGLCSLEEPNFSVVRCDNA